MGSSNDPDGHYAALGVPPTATFDQVKNAYRRLAKETHPDTSGSSSAARFQSISAAYAIVSDPEARAKYDSAGYQAEAEGTREATIDPICCSRCGQVAAQPRYVVFWRVYSLLLATIRSPVQGVFCAQCARKEAFAASLVTMFTGWWGVPWGPIHTIAAILRNGLGGRPSKVAQERMLWFNCLAFLSRGDLHLAHALASRSCSASDLAIAHKAQKLLHDLEATGYRPQQSRLRNPWRVRPMEFLKHLAMAAAMPLLITGLLVHYDSRTPSAARPVSHRTAPPSGRPPTAATDAAKPAESGQAMAVSGLVPRCALGPGNGHILEGRQNLTRIDGHVVTIRNGSGGNAIVRLRESVSNRRIASVFVADGATASLRKIPDGTYRIQYAFGDHLAKDCRSFVQTHRAGQFPGEETFATRTTATEIITQEMTYTLYAVPLGNVTPKSITTQEFDAQ